MNDMGVTLEADFERFMLDYAHEKERNRYHSGDYDDVFGLKALYESLEDDRIRQKFVESLIKMLMPGYHNPWSSSDPLVWVVVNPDEPRLIIPEVRKDDWACQSTAVVLSRLLGLKQTVPALLRLGEALDAETSRYEIGWLRAQVAISLSRLQE